MFPPRLQEVALLGLQASLSSPLSHHILLFYPSASLCPHFSFLKVTGDRGGTALRPQCSKPISKSKVKFREPEVRIHQQFKLQWVLLLNPNTLLELSSWTQKWQDQDKTQTAFPLQDQEKQVRGQLSEHRPWAPYMERIPTPLSQAN